MNGGLAARLQKFGQPGQRDPRAAFPAKLAPNMLFHQEINRYDHTACELSETLCRQAER